ncbi:affinity choline transporter 1 [Seminavis robusta]|uniref:Affinity choline transporter 1 n=1 Tax=Seminavis robusta TaxID=568900 RepID=A0A9N8HQZ3_9STRA|nr:affinity choline transporter 1 [Seminavis robusta]|eukprot:Sro1029_g233290.1 affinity choline transporter 1 (720) ;mRNA; r:19706-22054
MMRSFLLFLTALVPATATETCLSNEALNAEFMSGVEEPTCCQNDVCAIPCPEPVSDPAVGFSVAIIAAIAVSFLIGMATLFLVQGKAENFFVAGRSLPLWIVSMTLGAQSIDSNALLGNVDLSYKYHFWDGAVLPIGLGLSLILNGVFLAGHINKDYHGVLTLPDILAKRYGKVVEILVSLATIISFMMLLAGNLYGMGTIFSYLWGVSTEAGVWTASTIIWAYTVSGGLFSVAYTDVFQAIIGWSGCIACAYYMVVNEETKAPPPSIGFAGYVYPDGFGDGGACDMYAGVPCLNVEDACCYNVDKWCPSADNCTADNGAYPFGDQRVFQGQMTDHLSLAPFPNAIMWNWATIFILGFGNLAALDFQARCMAAKTPRTAQLGCIIGGLFTFFVGVPFAYLGAITRNHYGPDSVHAQFEADTCSTLLGLPTCAMWVPDSNAFIKLLTHEAPSFLGGWCLFGIVAASMSTADGAILAMGTVFSHNLMRQLDGWYPNLITNDNLLNMARGATIPLTLCSTLIAAYFDSGHPAGSTGYLLIVAFDIVLATVVVPLFGCYYTKTPRPNAALLACVSGILTRVILEFTLPKDGFLLLPYKDDEFLDYGSAASSALPVFFDNSTEVLWDPEVEMCDQRRFEDYTGVDSLAAFLMSFVVFVLVQTAEHFNGGPLFILPGMTPYIKDLGEEEEEEGEVVEGEVNEKMIDGSKKDMSEKLSDEISEVSA